MKWESCVVIRSGFVFPYKKTLCKFNSVIDICIDTNIKLYFSFSGFSMNFEYFLKSSNFTQNH